MNLLILKNTNLLQTKKFWIVTPYGVRLAVLNKGTFGFWLLDCEHPAQQAFFHYYMVSKWSYVYTSDKENPDLYIINKHEIQKQGQKILDSIKPTFKDKLLSFFKKKKSYSIKLLK